MSESNDKRSWVSKKLDDPSFRLGFQQEWASEQFCDVLESALEHEKLTRADLAKRMGRSRAYITKALRRGRNLTIKTMVELLASCGYDLCITARPRSATKDAVTLTVECVGSSWEELPAVGIYSKIVDLQGTRIWEDLRRESFGLEAVSLFEGPRPHPERSFTEPLLALSA
jgi:transcriptional regulator with XRE-family HTH domain